jgi:hypothetical protein
MSHKQYRDLIQLSLYDELSAHQKHALESHLNACEECRLEVERLRRLHRLLGYYRPAPVTDKQIDDARHSLRLSLMELPPLSPVERALQWIGSFPRLSPALAGVALFVAGVLSTSAVFLALRDRTPESNADPGVVTNVRFLDHDVKDGSISFTYQMVGEHTIRGSIDDPLIQRLLAQGLVNESNAGVRLKTVNTLAAAQENVDPEVKAALILTLRSDDNPGVRREALSALAQYPFDSQIKDAILTVLLHDPNSALRIAAINCLDSARVHGAASSEIRNVLEQKLRDANTYVRLRARTVLQEVNNHD